MSEVTDCTLESMIQKFKDFKARHNQLRRSKPVHSTRVTNYLARVPRRFVSIVRCKQQSWTRVVLRAWHLQVSN